MKTVAGKETKPASPTRSKSGKIRVSPGDRAEVRRLLAPPGVQPKVAVGPPGDRFEREADAVADRVAAGQPAPPISRLPASAASAPPQRQAGEEEEPVQASLQRQANEEEEPVQTKLVQRESGEDEEPIQTLQRQSEEEEPVQTIQRQAGEEEEPVQTIQRQRPEEEEPVQTIQRQEEEEEPIQTKLVQRQGAEEEDPVQTIQRQETQEEEPVQTQLIQRQPEEDEEEPVQASAPGSRSAAMSHAAQRAIDTKGAGRPVNPATRSTLESNMGADLSDVRVHDDSGAQSAARALNARAFTHDRNIWLGRGESDSDVPLMAHEATHVVQQRAAVQRALVQRQDETEAESEGVPDEVEKEARKKLETLKLPPIKARHLQLYQAWASKGSLKRVKGYDRGNPQQKDKVWIPKVTEREADLKRIHLDPNDPSTHVIDVGGKEISGTYKDLVKLIKVPTWGPDGKPGTHPLEVDHIVELQVGSWAGGSTGTANEIENMELLDKSSNASAGGSTKSSVRANVTQYLRDIGQYTGSQDTNEYLDKRDITFNAVEMRDKGRNESGSKYWTRAEIEQGAHLKDVKPVRSLGDVGDSEHYALVSPGGSQVLGKYKHEVAEAAEVKIPISDKAAQTGVAGLKMTAINLKAGYHSLAENPVGSVEAQWNLPQDLNAPTESFSIPLVKQGLYTGKLGDPPPLSADYRPASPIRFDEVTLSGAGISAMGQLTPTLPLLGTTPIEVALDGDALQFAYYYKPEELSLPIPGLTIDDATLGVFAGTEGFGAEGEIEFTVAGLGSGTLMAGASTAGDFEAAGSMAFDTELFDRAELEIWYREKAFGGRGTLGIDSPDKVPGVKSAEITATIEQDKFSATGTVAPMVPGVQEASLTVEYSEEEGLLIGGSLALADTVPGIKGGTVEAKVRRRPEAEGYELAASGTAQPAIPGVDTELRIDYAGGAITIEGSGGYGRGMLSGTLTVGATNRVVDEGGTPTDAIGEKITAYGSGSVSVTLTPWLQGTAGIRLLPNGEIELVGKIGLPDVLEIFPEKRYDKNLFSINLDIPIVGVAVAGQRIGIFATIGGGLDLSAGIGPGQLQELGLQITYNPDHEDQTHIEGGAKLVIPADAGLRMFVRAALGAGIPIVSASLGLEMGGQLGLQGALETSVQIDWMPATGLVLDAAAEIYVEPKFRFDITGFAEVTADLFITEISLYEKRWELAAVEVGSDYRLGMMFPFHYEEGQPFDIDFSTVEFQVPDVDPKELLDSLVDKIS